MGILKTKPLTQLLTQAISPTVSSALLFTPSGSLLATSAPSPAVTATARTHAALAATIWNAYTRALDAAPAALTLELSEHNLHMQRVGERVLLCLIGPKEGAGEMSGSERSVGSAGSRLGGGGLGVLKMQAVALGRYLETELEGFELPEGL